DLLHRVLGAGGDEGHDPVLGLRRIIAALAAPDERQQQRRAPAPRDECPALPDKRSPIRTVPHALAVHLSFESTMRICLASSISIRGTSCTSFTVPLARMVVSLKWPAGSPMPACFRLAAPVFVMTTAKFFSSRKSVSASR